jgi:hypothetical protein
VLPSESASATLSADDAATPQSVGADAAIGEAAETALVPVSGQRAPSRSVSESSESEQQPVDDVSPNKAGAAPSDAVTTLQTPLPGVESMLPAAGQTLLRLDGEGRFTNSAASIEGWPTDLRPALPRALTLNADKDQ